MRAFGSTLLASLLISTLCWAEPPPAAAPPPAQPEVLDERLRAEESWAQEDFERRRAAADGGVYVRKPAPGEPPKGAWDDIMAAVTASILGVIAGSLWGWRRRRKQARPRRRPRD